MRKSASLSAHAPSALLLLLLLPLLLLLLLPLPLLLLLLLPWAKSRRNSITATALFVGKRRCRRALFKCGIACVVRFLLRMHALTVFSSSVASILRVFSLFVVYAFRNVVVEIDDESPI